MTPRRLLLWLLLWLVGSTPDAQDLLSARGRAQVLEVLRDLVGECRAEGVGACLAERALRELRERRRLLDERLRLRATGSGWGWILRRLAGSAARELRELRAGLVERLPGS